MRQCNFKVCEPHHCVWASAQARLESLARDPLVEPGSRENVNVLYTFACRVYHGLPS